MNDFFNTLLPTVEHVGLVNYWLVFFLSFVESLAFVGEFIPGGFLMVFAGFLVSQGYMDFGDTVWFATIGAILGDGASYWFGRKGTRFFREENRFFKLSHIKKGEKFFHKHGKKSIFLGRFIGPMRPIVPFVAGLSRMRQQSFFFWNVISGFLWAVSYLSLGYFFGGAAQAVEAWITRAGFFILVALLGLSLLWFFLKRSRAILLLLDGTITSMTSAVVAHPLMQKVIVRYPRLYGFITRRVDRRKFSGLPLTVLCIFFVYIASLFFGIIEDVVTSDPIVTIDVRFANLLYFFRDATLIKFFTWMTLLGEWHIVVSTAVVVTMVLWLWGRRVYILPLWITLIGSKTFNIMGKYAFHRPRPDVAYFAEQGFSFPSGHATIAVALYGFLMYILVSETTRWRMKIVSIFWGVVTIMMIGLSRLYLGVHYISDVWGGYLSGLLVLMIGIVFVELMRDRFTVSVSHVTRNCAMGLSIFFIAVELAYYVAFALHYHPLLNEQKNSQDLITTDVLAPFFDKDIPKYTETLFGKKQEPINMVIIAAYYDALEYAMHGAGWVMADPTAIASVFQLAKSTALDQQYPQDPMKPLFWNTKPQDMGFEKMSRTKNFSERHNIRLWKTDMRTPDGWQVYVGTVGFDSDIKWAIVHKGHPDIDRARELFFADLQKADVVLSSQKDGFIVSPQMRNKSDGSFFTDGNIYIVTVKEGT